MASNVSDKIWSTLFSKVAEVKAFMLRRNIVYITNGFFGSDDISIKSNLLLKVI